MTSKRLQKEFERYEGEGEGERKQKDNFQEINLMKILFTQLQALNLGRTKSFAHWNARFNTQPYPGCEVYEFESDKYWECCIRHYSSSLQHQVKQLKYPRMLNLLKNSKSPLQVGTCRMGPKTDPTAVVNPQLQVYGIKNLRVVDASIMPEIVAAHTNAATFMIGEKASDMIKEYWSNSV